MATIDNSKVIRDLYAALDSKDPQRALSYFASSAEFKMAGEAMAHGHQEILAGFNSWFESFPDLRGEILNLVSSGDTVIVETINRGTHRGPLETDVGTLQGTGRTIAVPACDVFKFSGGKIISWNCYWQNDVMLKQLGVSTQKLAA